TTTLTQHQLAPPGFLVVERAMTRLPIDPLLAARMLPWLAGLASVVLFAAVARRYLERRAVPIAVVLFAFADYLLYYSTEAKPYAIDVALTLVALLLAARPAPALAAPRPLAALAIFGVVAPWFSYPIVFVLAGVGLWLIADRARHRRWGEALAILAMA